MKAYFANLLLALLVFSGCSKQSAPRIPDGVQVGNGMKPEFEAVSMKYKVFLQVENGFSTKEKSTNRWRVANEQGGSIQFSAFADGKVSEKEQFDFANPEALLAARHPGASFSKRAETGIIHFHAEEKKNDKTEQIDYWLTPRHDVISAVGDQKNSFILKADTRGPSVAKLEISQRRVTGGQAFPISLQLTDDQIGVRPEAHVSFTRLNGPKQENCEIEFQAKVPLIPGAGSDYSGQVLADATACPGDYLVRSVAVSDSASNYTTLKAQESATGFVLGLPYIGSAGKLSPQFITFEARPSDSLPGALFVTAIGTTQNEFQAGTAVIIRFATNRPIADLDSFWGTIACKEFPTFEIKMRTTARPLSENSYELTIPLSSFTPNGTYYIKTFLVENVRLRRKLNDAAEHFEASPLAIPTFKVVNSGEEDFSAPIVTGIAPLATTTSGKFHPGEVGKLRITAADNMSGIADFSWFVGLFNRIDFQNRKGPIGKSILAFGEIQKDQSGFYWVDFSIPEGTEPGIYGMTLFQIGDRAGNLRSLSFPGPADYLKGLRFYSGTGGHPVAIVVIEVFAPAS